MGLIPLSRRTQEIIEMATAPVLAKLCGLDVVTPVEEWEKFTVVEPPKDKAE